LFALVEYNREELKSKCLDDSSFKSFLDLVPNVKDMINYFYDSKYEKMLECLSVLRNELKYDYILSPHLDYILNEIRNKALIQYVSPYTQIDFKIMAKDFNTSVNEIENEVSKLIQKKKLKQELTLIIKFYVQQLEIKRILLYKHYLILVTNMKLMLKKIF